MVQLQLDFTTIRAPLDGRVGLRLVDPGSIVHATDLNGIVTITQMAPIGALFAVPQDDLPDVRTAMAFGDVPVEAFSRDSDRLLATGRLSRLRSIDQRFDPRFASLWCSIRGGWHGGKISGCGERRGARRLEVTCRVTRAWRSRQSARGAADPDGLEQSAYRRGVRRAG
jgi:hypothetical protein